MLELRPFVAADAPRLAALRNNPRILENGYDKTPNPYTLAAAEDFIAAQQAKQPVEAFAIWHGGELVGGIGLTLLADVFRHSAEVGYWLGEPYWGRGLATAAVGQLTDYAFRTFDVVRLVAGVFAGNQGSMRALEKNGYYLESIRRQAVVKQGKLLDDYVWVKLKNA